MGVCSTDKFTRDGVSDAICEQKAADDTSFHSLDGGLGGVGAAIVLKPGEECRERKL